MSRSRKDGKQNLASRVVFDAKYPVDTEITSLGYNANIQPFTNRSVRTMSDQALGLLADIDRLRTGTKERSIIFVARDFGGIVVKAALNAAMLRGGPDGDNIATKTVGIIFLGTPHRGLKMTRLLVVYGWLVGLPPFIKELRPGSDYLYNVSAGFSEVLRKRPGMRLFSFYETRKLGSLNGVIVGRDDATLGGAAEQVQPLDADHRELTRFSGPGEANYQRILTVIKALLKPVQQRLPEPRGLEVQDPQDGAFLTPATLAGNSRRALEDGPRGSEAFGRLSRSLAGPLLPTRIELQIGPTKHQVTAFVHVVGSTNLVPQSLLTAGGIDAPWEDDLTWMIELPFTFLEGEAGPQLRRFTVVRTGLDGTVILAGSTTSSDPGNQNVSNTPSVAGESHPPSSPPGGFGDVAATQQSMLLRQDDKKQVESPGPSLNPVQLQAAPSRAGSPPNYGLPSAEVAHDAQLAISRGSTALTAVSAGIETRSQGLIRLGAGALVNGVRVVGRDVAESAGWTSSNSLAAGALGVSGAALLTSTGSTYVTYQAAGTGRDALSLQRDVFEYNKRKDIAEGKAPPDDPTPSGPHQPSSPPNRAVQPAPRQQPPVQGSNRDARADAGGDEDGSSPQPLTSGSGQPRRPPAAHTKGSPSPVPSNRSTKRTEPVGRYQDAATNLLRNGPAPSRSFPQEQLKLRTLLGLHAPNHQPDQDKRNDAPGPPETPPASTSQDGVAMVEGHTTAPEVAHAPESLPRHAIPSKTEAEGQLKSRRRITSGAEAESIEMEIMLSSNDLEAFDESGAEPEPESPSQLATALFLATSDAGTDDSQLASEFQEENGPEIGRNIPQDEAGHATAEDGFAEPFPEDTQPAQGEKHHEADPADETLPEQQAPPSRPPGREVEEDDLTIEEEAHGRNSEQEHSSGEGGPIDDHTGDVANEVEGDEGPDQQAENPVMDDDDNPKLESTNSLAGGDTGLEADSSAAAGRTTEGGEAVMEKTETTPPPGGAQACDAGGD